MPMATTAGGDAAVIREAVKIPAPWVAEYGHQSDSKTPLPV